MAIEVFNRPVGFLGAGAYPIHKRKLILPELAELSESILEFWDDAAKCRTTMITMLRRAEPKHRITARIRQRSLNSFATEIARSRNYSVILKLPECQLWAVGKIWVITICLNAMVLNLQQRVSSLRCNGCISLQ